MILAHEWNTTERRWEFGLSIEGGKYYSPVYLNPNRTEAEKYSDLVNWLNKCFREYDEKKASSQSV